MLLANRFRVPMPSNFLLALENAVHDSPDWSTLRNPAAHWCEIIRARYTGPNFQGRNLTLSVLPDPRDPTLFHLILRADQWPDQICFRPEHRPESLVRPRLEAALKSARPRLSIRRPPRPRRTSPLRKSR